MALVSKLTRVGDHFISGEYDEYTIRNDLFYATSFNGSNQYLSAPNTVSNFGTGDFTAECWIYPTSAASLNFLGNTDGGTDVNYWTVGRYVSGVIELQIRDSGGQLFVTGSIGTPLNTWTHIAVSRQSGLCRLFVNGISDGTPLTITKTITSRSTIIGAFLVTGFVNYFGGYVSNVRIIKGTGLYTTAFTPPTLPLTAVTNTSLLTCQNQILADNSTNGYTISNPNSATTLLPSSNWSKLKSKQFSNGDLDITGEFDEVTYYQDNLRMYSVLLNGTNQYINTGIGTTTSTVFTVECHLYLTSWLRTTGAGGYIGVIYGGNAGNAPWFVLSGTASSITGIFHAAVGGASADKSWSISGGLQLNTWYHIALSRNGSTWAVWINGVKLSNPGNTGPAYVFASGTMTIGVNLNNAGYAGYIPGYISNFKVVSGSTTYDPTGGDITVPTNPYRNVKTTYYLYQCAASTVSGGVNGPTASTFVPFLPKITKQFSNGSFATVGSFDEVTGII
jgi:hypothetical protein